MRTKALLFSLLIFSQSFGSQHYFQAPLFQEPFLGIHLDTEKLFNLYVKIRSGSTRKGLNLCGQEANILNIYGCTDLNYIAKGAPQYILDRNPNCLLNDLWEQNGLGCFGKIQFNGKFRSTELIFNVSQNLSAGFFAGLELPITNHKFRQITYKDLTRLWEIPSTITHSEWQYFINNLPEQLLKYGTCLPKASSQSGLEEITFFSGWSYSYDKTDYLDFIDFSATVGITVPTSTEKNSIFSLGHGIQQLKSVPISFNFAIGLWDWLNLGTAVGTRIYIKSLQTVPMKTDSQQCGIIKLTKGCATVRQKPLFIYSFYLKAENFCLKNGLSILFAYEYDRQGKTTLWPHDTNIFNVTVANDDIQLHKWDMQTIHLSFDYDFGTEEKPYLPTLGVFFDIVVDGKLIFENNMGGLGISLATTW